MGSAMHIGVVILVVVADGVDDNLGFLGGGSIVQIDQRGHGFGAAISESRCECSLNA